MKFINNFKSPNFNTRKGNSISFIIIHYTSLKDHNKAISYLCNKKNKVSSHYLISQEGNIFNLVDENKRAWHAGLSDWDGISDINSYSIGIELDYSKNKKNNKYSTKMINSLVYLLKYLKKKYLIKNINILGHSDIAPFRKIDPGHKFPWKKLYLNNLSFDPYAHKNLHKNIASLDSWFYRNNIISERKKILFILGLIGYDTLKIVKKNYSYKELLLAYQSHYLQSNITGKPDNITIKYIKKHLLNYLLTKK